MFRGWAGQIPLTRNEIAHLLAVLGRADRAVGDQGPVLGVKRAALDAITPAGVGDRQGVGGWRVR